MNFFLFNKIEQTWIGCLIQTFCRRWIFRQLLFVIYFIACFSFSSCSWTKIDVKNQLFFFVTVCTLMQSNESALLLKTRQIFPFEKYRINCARYSDYKVQKNKALWIFSINHYFFLTSVRSPEGFLANSFPEFYPLYSQCLAVFRSLVVQSNDFKRVILFRKFLLIGSERSKFASWIKQLNSPHTLNWYCKCELVW